MSSVSYVNVNSNYDMDNGGSSGFQLCIVDCSNGSITLKLTGDDKYDGLVYNILRKDSNAQNSLTITSYNTVNGGSSKILGISEYVTALYDGNNNNWIVYGSTISF